MERGAAGGAARGGGRGAERLNFVTFALLVHLVLRPGFPDFADFKKSLLTWWTSRLSPLEDGMCAALLLIRVYVIRLSSLL